MLRSSGQTFFLGLRWHPELKFISGIVQQLFWSMLVLATARFDNISKIMTIIILPDRLPKADIPQLIRNAKYLICYEVNTN